MSLPTSVLPVLDLKDGQVVHARAGRRSDYLPLESRWCRQADDPLLLVDALQRQLGTKQYYLADLNALEGHLPQRDMIARLLDAGLQLWLDAGVSSLEESERWLSLGVERIIVASETLRSRADLHVLFQRDSSHRHIFSLDLVDGRLRCIPGVFTSDEPLAIVEEVVKAGCRQIIILDTASVGTSQGPATLDLCRQVHKQHPDCTIISGGGVRNRLDIQQFEDAGVARVLVSTWLHQGCS